MCNASSHRKRYQGKRNFRFIRALFLVISLSGFLKINAQALLLEGASGPFVLKQLVSPFAELKEVDTVVVISERRIAVRKTGELGFRMYTSGLETLNGSMANEVRKESEGYIPFRIGEKWGMADTMGEVTIKPKFEDIGPLSEGLIWVKEKGEWGFVNKDGKWVKKPFFTNPDLTGLPLRFLMKITVFINPDKTVSYLMQDGKIVKTAHSVGDLGYEELLQMRLSSFRLLTAPDKWVADEYYDYPSFSAKSTDSVLIFRKDGLSGFVKYRTGKTIANPKFSDASFIDEGTAAVKTENGWTLMDIDGNLCKHEFFDSLSRSYKGVHIYSTGKGDDRWMGLIIKNCEILVPGTYRQINEFKDNYAVCSKDDISFNYLDLNGDEVFRRKSFEKAEPSKGGFGVVFHGGKWEVKNLRDPLALPVYTSVARNSFRLISLAR